MGSRVPPAVTTTDSPAISPASAPERIRPTAAVMSAGELSRPAPSSPPAKRPDSGPTMQTPRSTRVAMLSTTAGCSHISVCMAGQTTTGARVAMRVAVSRSELMPAA